MALSDEPEKTLIECAVAGDDTAAAALELRAAKAIRQVCLSRSLSERDAREAEQDVLRGLKAERFAAYRGWDGSGSFDQFVVIETGWRLMARIRRLLVEDVASGWPAFQGMFGQQIKAQARAMFADYDGHADACQFVCVKLSSPRSTEDGPDGGAQATGSVSVAVATDLGPCWRLRAFNGTGSFPGFVRTLVTRLLHDYRRSQDGRPHLPEFMKGRPKLEQAIFKAVYGAGSPSSPSALMAVIAWDLPGVTLHDVSAAHAQMMTRVPLGFVWRLRKVSTDTPMNDGEDSTLGDALIDGLDGEAYPTPEEELAAKQEERLYRDAADALRRILPSLDPDQREYVEAFLLGIRRDKMPWPVKEVDRRRRAALPVLRRLLTADSAVQAWRPSLREREHAIR